MGLFFEILSIVLWRSFDVLGQFTREARARLHAPSERLDEAAIAFPAAGLGGGERGVRQGRGRGQPEADEQRHRFVGDCDMMFEPVGLRSEEHTSELQSLMRISYA